MTSLQPVGVGVTVPVGVTDGVVMGTGVSGMFCLLQMLFWASHAPSRSNATAIQ